MSAENLLGQINVKFNRYFFFLSKRHVFTDQFQETLESHTYDKQQTHNIVIHYLLKKKIQLPHFHDLQYIRNVHYVYGMYLLLINIDAQGRPISKTSGY